MHSVPADTEAVHTGGWSLLHPRTWFALGQVRLVGRAGDRGAGALLRVPWVRGIGNGCAIWCLTRISPWRPGRCTGCLSSLWTIDEASLTALGQWPWPRTRLARLIEAIHQLGAQAIGLDMIMPEADRLSPDVFIAERSDVSPALRQELAQLPSNDALLAETLQRTSAVVGRAGTPESKPAPVPVDDPDACAHLRGDATRLCAIAIRGT